MKIKHGIMKEMRISNYGRYENAELWTIWECQIMNDMRMQNYEWYENIELWKKWECKNYERYEKYK